MKRQEPRVVFRYKEELITLYNKGVKKFLKMLWFVSLVATVAFFMLDKEKFFAEFYKTMFGFFILILFSAFIYIKTIRFREKIAKFLTHGKKVRGRIEDLVMGEDKKPRLLISYKINNESKNFLSEPVIGDPKKLLKSRLVDVYVLGDECFATNFRPALEGEKSYGEV